MILLTSKRSHARDRGFALVVTLSLMILLTIVAVGLLTLSAVSLRASSQGDAGSVARANARIALMMAIGELQREMGPDSRISAPFDAGTTATGGQPHWTAVYDSWKRASDDGSTPEAPQSRIPKFRGWLASGANEAIGGPAGTADKVILVGPGSLGTDGTANDEVRVPMHAISTGTQRGRIAWWSSDESTKAKVTAGPDGMAASFGISDPLFNSQSAPNVGHRAFAKLEQFAWKDGKKAMTVSTNQINLAAELGARGLGKSIHDLTVHSAGVLADVRAGRLKRDLGNLLARPVTEVEDKPLYLADGRMNPFNITAEGAISNPGFVTDWQQSANTAAEWGINLEELHLFQNLHRELTWTNGKPSLVMKGTREEVVKDRYYLYKRPMIDAVQFILSLKAFPSTGGNYKMEMMLDGVVALANPNDIPIQWPAGLLLPVQLQNIPYNLTWQIKDELGSSKNSATADSPNFGLFVGRVGGGHNAAAAGFTLAPGESATFGSTTASGANLDLLPGFDPSGGVRMTGWNLRADKLKATDKIDFSFNKDSATGFSGTYTYYNSWIGPRNSGSNAKGWQSDTASLSSGGDLNSPLMNSLMPSPVRPPQVRPVSDFINDAQAVLMISFLRNVEQSSGAVPMDAFASRPFQMNEPASAGRGLTPATMESARHSTQLLITAEPMNYQFRTLAAGDGGRNVYHGGGRQPNLGGTLNVIKRRIPVAPPMSLGAFENAIASGFCGHFNEPGAPAIGGDPYPANAVALSGHRYAWPLTAKAIGNSYNLPFLNPDQVYRRGTGNSPTTKGATDHSWMVNTALWDSWFLSSIVDGAGVGSSAWVKDARSPRAQFRDLAEGKGTLRNKRFQFYPHKSPQEAQKELFNGEALKPAALNKLSKYLLVDGAFNVNSTSTDAWEAFLSSVRDQELLTENGSTKPFDHPFGTLGYAQNTATSGTAGDWSGLRNLTSAELGKLAEAIVSEVKTRGPFLSLADFINRRPDSSEYNQQSLGALQAAIDLSGINGRLSRAGRSVTSTDFAPLPGSSGIDKEPNPARAVSSAGHLTQAAVLTAIGSQVTVRSDTFVIRTYGDARDSSGKILAQAWCEAVIQRVPEYVDIQNEPEAQDGWPKPSDKLSTVNSRFGRRIVVQSFRWLNSNEV